MQRGSTWRSLIDVKDVDVHYQTIYKRFKKLGRQGIMKIIWDKLLATYSELMLSIDRKHFGAVFLDSSMIYNSMGIETTGKNHYDRNRLGTKVSAIVDVNKVPISLSFYPANQHDSTTTLQSVEEIGCKIKPDRRYKNKHHCR